MGAVNAADHVGLVYRLASYYCGRGLERDELVSEGTIGLMSAVRKFDPARGLAFSTYAAWWICSAMSSAVRQSARPPRGDRDAECLADSGPSVEAMAIDRQTREAVGRAVARIESHRTRRILAMRFREDLTLSEIGAEFGVCRERVRQIIAEALEQLRPALEFAIA